jgi:hypothetical protein
LLWEDEILQTGSTTTGTLLMVREFSSILGGFRAYFDGNEWLERSISAGAMCATIPIIEGKRHVHGKQ